MTILFPWRHPTRWWRVNLQPASFMSIIVLGMLATILPGKLVFGQKAVVESVRERPRLDFESFGFSFRALMGDKERSGPRKPADQLTVYTRVETGAGYNSNVLRTADNEKASAFTSIKPLLAIHTDWDKHGLNLVLKADARVFASESRENKLDVAARLGGHYDLANDDIAQWNVEAVRVQSPRGSSDDLGPSFEPQVVNRYTVGALFNRGRDDDVRFRADARAIRYDYQKIGSISRDELDSTQFLLDAVAAIGADSVIGLFAVPGVTITTYDQNFHSDSIVYDLALGWRIDSSALTAAIGKIGVTHRDFERTTETDITSLLFESEEWWNATPLITVRNDAFVRTDDAQSEAGGGKITASMDFGLDYELYENLILSSTMGYRSERFEGVNRDDDTFRSSFGAIYLIGDRYFIRGDLGLESRESTIASESYDEATVFLRFGIKNCCLGDKGLVNAFAEGVKDVFR